MISVYSVSLGCPKNRVDTERTLGLLGPVETVETVEEADLVFINTCGFIAPAVEESVRTILDTAALVGEQPEATRPALVVAGCLVGRYGKDTLSPDLPEADLILESSALGDWPGQILALLRRLGKIKKISPPRPDRLLSTGPSYAWLKISEGCRHKCSFCSIPLIRGPLASIPAHVLEEEARLMLDKGVHELIVVAQDITAWGSDFKTPSRLEHLLERLLPLPGLSRLRLMYMYPAGLDDAFLQFLKDAGEPFVPYFDVPVQHAASAVLSAMGRPFAGNPRKALDRLRKYFPEAALRTSIITGFPGETEKDFDELCAFVQEVRFHHLGVFPYYREEGTPAAAMKNQVPDDIKQWRKNTLMALQREISSEIMGQYVGEKLDILVDRVNPEWEGLCEGRAWFQTPEIDGLTYISGPGVKPGALVTAEITENTDYDLVALI